MDASFSVLNTLSILTTDAYYDLEHLQLNKLTLRTQIPTQTAQMNLQPNLMVPGMVCILCLAYEQLSTHEAMIISVQFEFAMCS